MNKDIFNYPKEIPEYIKELPIYRTAKYRTYSRREDVAQREIDTRIKLYTKLFNIKAEPKDLGEIVVFRDKDYKLEIFRASDSLRWIHNELADRTKIPKGAKLPEEKEAFDIAVKYLRKFKLYNKYAKIKSLTHTEFARSTLVQKEKPKLVKIEAHVFFSFSLDGIPVMGPGAKIKVSLVENDKMSGLLYFWREPIKEKAMQLIHPVDALKKLTNDPSFMRLSPDTAVVNLHRIQFGYYALTPTAFQRYLIPVYAITGTVKTEYLDRYDFTNYVVAVDLTPDEIKKAGIVADPSSCTIL
jgi:hypothetical protein